MHDEALSVAELEAREAAIAARAEVEAARFDEWLASQSVELQALAAKLFEIQDQRKMAHGFDARVLRARDGGVIYEVSCLNGVHQSRENFEHALELLVRSFRTGIEDLESTHQRVLAYRGGHIKDARKVCAEAAERVRRANPDVHEEALDELVLAEIGRLETAHRDYLANATKNAQPPAWMREPR